MRKIVRELRGGRTSTQSILPIETLVFDLQRYLAKTAYALYPPGVGTGFLVAWPCIGNFHVYQGGRLNYQLWVDDTKPPFKSA